MRGTQFSISGAHGSSPTDRRISALARHLVGDSASSMASQNPNDQTIAPSPTAAFHGDSVFANIVQAPEDPILGVCSSSLGFFILLLLLLL